jgi:hypothetical protein
MKTFKEIVVTLAAWVTYAPFLLAIVMCLIAFFLSIRAFAWEEAIFFAGATLTSFYAHNKWAFLCVGKVVCYLECDWRV